MVFPSFYYARPGEQLVIRNATSTQVANGPCRRFCTFGETVTTREGLLLDKLSFVKVQNATTGEVVVVQGPRMHFLGPYDKVLEQGKAVCLAQGATEYLHVEDTLTGEQQVVKGPCTFFPEPYQRIVVRKEVIAMKLDEYICVKDVTNGRVWVEKGPKALILEPSQRTLFQTPKKAISLKANEYVHLHNKVTGQVRMEKGEQMVFPADMEEIIGGDKQEAVSLKVFEFVKVLNSNTGEVRLERGEKVLFLAPGEKLMTGVQTAREVNDETAILVFDQGSGQQRLVTTPGLFFPAAHEDLVEVRKLQTLADYEVMIMRDKEGAFSFFHGASTRAGERRSFFVPPHCEVVTLLWSRGRRREKHDLNIQKVDCRPQYMSFEFNCRTSDNVELVLEGTFFWQIVDVPQMVQNTGDTTGDVCNHARSRFIQLISKVTLQTFMNSFNSIAREAHTNDDEFYRSRGVVVHSLEVTGYRCADASTAKILEEIVQETTNRMNRLSQQESENEVKLHKMKGEIEQANMNTELLKIKLDHLVEEARVEGTAEAERVRAFLKGLEEDVPDKATRVALWHTLRKNDALETVSKGNAQVYFTPADCNLSIEHRSAKPSLMDSVE